MELVQRVLFVLHPASSRTLLHTAVPAKWCTGFFLPSSYLCCALSFENLLCRCFQCANSWVVISGLCGVVFFFFFFFFFFFSWVTSFEAVVEFCNWWTTGECVSAPASWSLDLHMQCNNRYESLICLETVGAMSTATFFECVPSWKYKTSQAGQPKNWSRLVFSFKQCVKANT